METKFMSMKNSKTNEPHRFVLNSSQRLVLRSSNKHVLQNLSIYYTWKNIRKQYKNNKLNRIAPTWNQKCPNAPKCPDTPPPPPPPRELYTTNTIFTCRK